MRQRTGSIVVALGIAAAFLAAAAAHEVGEAPNPAVEIFASEGKNPGSAASPRSPGRVRQDAPAQFELNRQRFYTPENLQRIPALRPAEPQPWPELDPRFHDAVRMSEDTRSDDFPYIVSNPSNPEEAWVVWASYSGRRDELHLASRVSATGYWSPWNPVPGVTGDVWRPALAFDGAGRLWVIWAQQELFEANFDLYARWYRDGRWGPLERLTSSPEGDFDHAVARGPDGAIHVVWQGFREGQSDVFHIRYDGSSWSQPLEVSESPANDWAPAVAVDDRGTALVAWDTYDRGSYDVLLRPIAGGKLGPIREVAATGLFEARPSVAVDGEGRVWVAYEVGEHGWGKDQGRMIVRDPQPGARLNKEKQILVQVIDGDSVTAAEPEVASFFPDSPETWFRGTDPVLGNPLLIRDGGGRIHLLARNLTARGNVPGQSFAHALTMTGDGWSRPALAPYSETTRGSAFLSAAPAPDGGLWVAWTRDNSPGFNMAADLPEETIIENVYCGRYDPEPAAPGLKTGPPENPPFIERPLAHPNEAEDVARIRAWRVRAGGTSYQILRGDTHRHTEFSMDIGVSPDGSVLDFYRYMLDAAAMDWGLVSDHQYGADREYWWWLTEKAADLFHSPERYVSLFGYERSVNWPNGHRNVVHASRGIRHVPFFFKFDDAIPVRLTNAAIEVQEDDTKLLYESIRRTRGIAISHTSATSMGTDWRDNDPELEPVVELGQGDRYSYEYFGAPLGDPKEAEAGSSKYEKGFVRNAWDKGLRLGVILSSDHLSTHISYAMVWTPERSREAILDAIRARRTYAATDNIVLEFWVGDHFMGEEFAAAKVPPIRVKVVGTAAISELVVFRNGETVYSNASGAKQAEVSFTDLAPRPGLNYYYARVLQQDRQAAWSSPIWVNLEEAR